MKIKFLATGNAPTHYSFNGDVATAHYGDQQEDFDLSGLQHGDRFQGVSVDDLDLSPGHIIRAAERDSNGELHLTLCQKVIAAQYPGKKARWREGLEIDAESYDPDACYVVPTGMAGIADCAIVKGRDVAGVEGWTVIEEAGNG